MPKPKKQVRQEAPDIQGQDEAITKLRDWAVPCLGQIGEEIAASLADSKSIPKIPLGKFIGLSYLLDRKPDRLWTSVKYCGRSDLGVSHVIAKFSAWYGTNGSGLIYAIHRAGISVDWTCKSCVFKVLNQLFEADKMPTFEWYRNVTHDCGA